MVSSRTPERQAARNATRIAPTTALSDQMASPQEGFLPSFAAPFRKETARPATTASARPTASTQAQAGSRTMRRRTGSIYG